MNICKSCKYTCTWRGPAEICIDHDPIISTNKIIVCSPDAMMEIKNGGEARSSAGAKCDPLLADVWRDISSDKSYNNLGRVLVFAPCYPKGSEMRVRVISSQFVRILTDATMWKPIVEPNVG